MERAKNLSLWVVYQVHYIWIVKVLLLGTVESGNYLRRGASCSLVFTEGLRK